jgi:hypothetical protein
MKHKHLTTQELIDFAISSGVCIEAVIHHGAIKCTHWLRWRPRKKVFVHEGISPGEDEITCEEFLKMYPKTVWTIDESVCG